MPGKIDGALGEGLAAHPGKGKAVHFVAEQANPATIPKTFDAAVDLAVVEGLQNVLRLRAPPPED